MTKTILQYQRAFNTVVDRIKIDESVLSVMVFGSVVTGDLWEQSDIDLFVITKENFEKIRNIYTEEKGVSVHIKLMGKEQFIRIYSDNLKGGNMHRIFSSSRLVFSKDSINSSIRSNCNLLLNYMREKDKLLSAEEIMEDDLFKDFDIDMEELLNKLWERRIIKKESRDFKLDNEKILFKQNVYFV